jgi:hypothetical protein
MTEKPPPRVLYNEVPLATVVMAFAKGFLPNDPTQEIFHAEFFVDPTKGVVVYKLFVQDREDTQTPP